MEVQGYNNEDEIHNFLIHIVENNFFSSFIKTNPFVKVTTTEVQGYKTPSTNRQSLHDKIHCMSQIGLKMTSFLKGFDTKFVKNYVWGKTK